MVYLPIFEELAAKYVRLDVRAGRHHWKPTPRPRQPWPVAASFEYDPPTDELPAVPAPRGET